MDFIQSSNKQVDKFGPGKHGFSAGNPTGGIFATFFTNLWADGVQQEIINAIEAAGLAPSGADLSQLMKAIRKLAAPRLHVVTATGNFTVPPDVYVLDVEIWGGAGSGGGSGSIGNGSASGGGSGGYSRGIILVTPGQVIPCTIGVGGDALANAAGGASSFGAYLTAGGGGPGSGNGIGTGGAGGAIGTGGLINLAGVSGSGGLTSGGGVGGVGGGACFGGAGGGTGIGPAAAGGIPGGGGGGRGSGSTGSGAAGARGQINIRC